MLLNDVFVKIDLDHQIHSQADELELVAAGIKDGFDKLLAQNFEHH